MTDVFYNILFSLFLFLFDILWSRSNLSYIKQTSDISITHRTLIGMIN